MNRKTRVVYQVGYYSHYGWDSCAWGETLQKARKELSEKQPDTSLRYEENKHYEVWRENDGWHTVKVETI